MQAKDKEICKCRYVVVEMKIDITTTTTGTTTTMARLVPFDKYRFSVSTKL